MIPEGFAASPLLTVCTAGFQPDRKQLMTLIDQNIKQFEYCPESRLPPIYGEKLAAANQRRHTQYNTTKSGLVNLIVEDLLRQWPRPTAAIPANSNRTYIDPRDVDPVVQTLFQSWYRNNQFQVYVNQIQATLDLVYEVVETPDRLVIFGAQSFLLNVSWKLYTCC